MHENDLRISRRLQTIARKVSALIDKECGEPMGVVLMLQAYAPTKEREGEIREFQYIATFERAHVIEMMRAMVAKYDRGETGVSVPPHERQ